MKKLLVICILSLFTALVAEDEELVRYEDYDKGFSFHVGVVYAMGIEDDYDWYSRSYGTQNLAFRAELRKEMFKKYLPLYTKANEVNEKLLSFVLGSFIGIAMRTGGTENISDSYKNKLASHDLSTRFSAPYLGMSYMYKFKDRGSPTTFVENTCALAYVMRRTNFTTTSNSDNSFEYDGENVYACEEVKNESIGGSAAGVGVYIGMGVLSGKHDTYVYLPVGFTF